MQVSVIIPLFNRKQLIGYTLDSLKSELHVGVEIEVVVVDDGSTDGAFEYVKEAYPWVRLFKNPNKGAPSARNFGLQHASFEFVMYLDSDDILGEDFFKNKLSILANDVAVDAVYGNWESFKGNGPLLSCDWLKHHTKYPIVEKEDAAYHIQQLMLGAYIHPSAMVFRKSSVEAIGGHIESLPVNQDVDFLFRFLIHNYKLIGENEGTSYAREHNDNRVGQVLAKDLKKMQAIYKLRRRFVIDLKKTGYWNNEIANCIAEYCFYRFAEYRKHHPRIAQKFYKLSKSLNPNFQLKGGVIYKVLGTVMGNKNAVILKQSLKR